MGGDGCDGAVVDVAVAVESGDDGDEGFAAVEEEEGEDDDDDDDVLFFLFLMVPYILKIEALGIDEILKRPYSFSYVPFLCVMFAA